MAGLKAITKRGSNHYRLCHSSSGKAKNLPRLAFRPQGRYKIKHYQALSKIKRLQALFFT